MIPNYAPPQSTISQYLDIVVPGTGDRRNVLAIGAQYQVQRYVDGTTPLSTGIVYTPGMTLVPVGFVADGILDPNYTQIFAKNLQLTTSQLITGDSLHFAPETLQDPQTVALYTAADNSTTGVLAGTSLNTAFQGRSIQIGDSITFVSTLSSANTCTRKVTSLIGVPVAPTTGAFTSSVGNPITATGNFIPVSATGPDSSYIIQNGGANFVDDINRPIYNGYYGDRITIFVTTAGGPGVGLVSIRSASGFYNYDNVSLARESASNLVLGQAVGGVIFQIDAIPAVSLGSTWTVDLRGGYTPLTATASGTYTGTTNTTYVIRVAQGGAPGTATFAISDSAGVDVPVTITSPSTYTTPFAVGTLGITVAFTSDPSSEPQGGFCTGDAYTVAVTAATNSTTSFSAVTLNGPAYQAAWFPGATDNTGITLSATVSTPFSGYIGQQEADDFTLNYTTGTLAPAGVTLRTGLDLPVLTDVGGTLWAPAITGTGLVFLTARALVPPALGESYLTITSTTDVLTMLGGNDPDNALGSLVTSALIGGQGKNVYVLRVASEDAPGYTAALAKAENQDIFYALVTTADAPVVKAVIQAHVDSMSSPTEENFRMAFVPVTSPTEYAISQFEPNGAPILCTVTVFNGQNVRLRQEDGAFTTLGLYAGDVVRLNYGTDGWGNVTFTEYPIAAVVSDQELTLATPVPSAILVPSKFEIWKPGSAQNVVNYLSGIANSTVDRRVSYVWVDNPQILNSTGTAYVTQHVANVAGEIAGFRGFSAPQQGLTNMAVSTVAQAPTMYTKFSKQNLNDIASAGIMIVTQQQPNNSVFIRHELTSDTTRGVLYYENMVTSNLDSVCYGIKDVVNSFTGTWNATPTTLALMQNKLNTLMLGFANAPANDQIGTQIISFDDTFGNQNRVYVAFSPTNADRFIVKVNIVVPVPLNGTDVYTYAQEFSVSTGTVVTAPATA